MTAFLNLMTSADVLAAADNPDATTTNGQVCEVDFYSGELSLTKGAQEEAIRLFRVATNDCAHGYLEWDGAITEEGARRAAASRLSLTPATPRSRMP